MKKCKLYNVKWKNIVLHRFIIWYSFNLSVAPEPLPNDYIKGRQNTSILLPHV